LQQRPAVQFLQSASAQTKYFSVEQFTQLATTCDLRLRAGNNGDSPRLSDTDVLVLGWGAPPATAEQIEQAQRLKLVIVLGGSVNWAVPTGPLFERGVLLCNTADAIAQSVAEHCLMLTLAGLRRLTEVDHGIRRGDWPPQSLRPFSAASLIKKARKLPMVETLKPMLRPVARGMMARASASAHPAAWNDLQGQVVGLLGWGHIAKRFAELLQPFHCKLLVCSEFASREELASFGAQQTSLGEVLGASKVISLHKGLTDRTRNMLNERTLALIQRGSVLVNTARAGLIDEAALIARARKGDIVIALDVFHQEPLPKRHPLRQLENVILSPHNASSTPQCNRRVGEAAVSILADWLAGKPVPSLGRARLATMS
jgi:phosphoglycerate dehydrogenase-like enzyme